MIIVWLNILMKRKIDTYLLNITSICFNYECLNNLRRRNCVNSFFEWVGQLPSHFYKNEHNTINLPRQHICTVRWTLIHNVFGEFQIMNKESSFSDRFSTNIIWFSALKKNSHNWPFVYRISACLFPLLKAAASIYFDEMAQNLQRRFCRLITAST